MLTWFPLALENGAGDIKILPESQEKVRKDNIRKVYTASKNISFCSYISYVVFQIKKTVSVFSEYWGK